MLTFVLIIGSCVLQPAIRAAADVSAAVSSSRFRAEYLRQFGYLGSTDTVPRGINVLSDEAESRSGDLDDFVWIPNEVVQQLQLYAGVEQTGEFDEPTIQMMMTPRCQNPDIIDDSSNSLTRFFLGERVEGRKKRFAGQPETPRWDKMELSFAFENTTFQNPRAREIINSAFAAWGECTKLTFHAGDDLADIKIKFASRLHEPPAGCAFDGPGGVKAHAFYPPQGLAHFDEDEDWSNDCVLYSVALHEIGHLLGLGHSFHKSSIMFAYFNSDFVKERCDGRSSRPLSSYDIEGARAMYGSVSCDKVEDPDPSPTPTPTAAPLPHSSSEGSLEIATTAPGETTTSEIGTSATEFTPSGSYPATYATGAANSWNLDCGEISDNVLSSPYYPELYPNKMNCTWNIYLPQGMGTINMYFIDFEIEDGGEDCVFDYLKVTDEDGTFQKLCGTRTESLKFRSKSVVVNFVSDTLKQYAGFKVLVVFDKIPPCLKVFEDGEGVVRESHPDLDMRDHEKCTYHIKSSDPGKQIMIIIDDIGDDCGNYELLTEEDGTENLIGSCEEVGTGVRHFISPSDSFFITFRPQDQVHFTVKYYAIFRDNWRNCTDSEEFLESKVWSPKLDANYNRLYSRPTLYVPNTDCILYIPRHEEGKQQFLTFIDFDLEEDKRCSYDFVEVYTMENGTNRHCGQSRSVEYTTLGDSLVYFHSDGSVEETGFTLQLSVYACEKELVRTDGAVSLEHDCTYTFTYSNNIGHFLCTDLLANKGRCNNNHVSIGDSEEKNCKSFSKYIYGGGEAEMKVHKETESNYTMRYYRINDEIRDCSKSIVVTREDRTTHRFKLRNHRDDRSTGSCLWRLIGKPGYQIVLTFTFVNLKRSCDQEYITVHPSNKGCEGEKKLCNTLGGGKKQGHIVMTLESQNAYILFSLLDRKSQFKVKMKIEKFEAVTTLFTTTSTAVTTPLPGPDTNLENFTLRATCDNILTIYVDGDLQEPDELADHDRWWLESTVSVPDYFNVIAMKCVDTGYHEGILASVENTSGETVFLTDHSSWKCSTEFEEGWEQIDFTTTSGNWQAASKKGDHGVEPWGNIGQISRSAKWIWATDYTSQEVYCRGVYNSGFSEDDDSVSEHDPFDATNLPDYQVKGDRSKGGRDREGYQRGRP